MAPGERVRVRRVNDSMMFHPIHLPGHTFAVARRGVRKDNLNVLPMQQIDIDLVADNPGRWAVPCHKVYHMELGMMTSIAYEV